jgi:hypothetical protein
MITVKAIFENETAKPEYIPETNLGSNFDGVNFIYFESENEKIEYYKQFEIIE